MLRRAGELRARTIVFDVEPLVAPWDTSQRALDEGVARVLRQARAVPGVQVVCFATNSARRPSAQIPVGPRLLGYGGELIGPLLFTPGA